MIKQLYVFSVDSYVVASEWNANFNAIDKSNADCLQAIEDAENELAFADGDLTLFFDAIRSEINSESYTGVSAPIVARPEHEYYKSLATGEDLTVDIPTGFTGEFRIWLKHTDKRQLSPIQFNFDGGTVSWENGFSNWYSAGTKIVFVYVINGVAYVKMIKTE